MSFRFIIGRSGTGKTTFILDEIQRKLKEEPNGSPILYIVPDQMTFISEYSMASLPGLEGMIRSQVYSFTRLAWRILQETGGISRTHLSSAGLNMLIRKIIEDKKEDLKLFGRAADKAGFLEHVEMMLTEFKRYCITPEDLLEKKREVEEVSQTKALADKLHDLELIYSEFERNLSGKYLDSDDYLKLLAESILKSAYLENAEIYVDGFHSFTPQEYLVLGELAKKCSRVSVALTTDRSYRYEEPNDLHLFRMTGETYSSLYQMAIEKGISVEEDAILSHTVRYQSSSLKFLEQHFESRPIQTFHDHADILLSQAANRRAEIEGVTREIRRLAREGLRYQDMAVLVRNGADYQELIETIFYDNEIPFFIDEKRPMLNHPLIELIRSTLEIMNTHWRYEPVFRAVKTDLLFPLESRFQELREKMDRLENYVLAHGIQGDKWVSKERWTYRRIRGLEMANMPQTDAEREIEHEINELRLFISAPILRFSRRLKRAKDGRSLCEALYLYLEELDIPGKLEKLRLEAEDREDLVSAREHDQAWNSVIDLMDQFVEMLGDQSITLKQFSKIMDAGLESMKFAIVPPALDQVLVANLELSRLSNITAAFMLGLNDGIIPARITEDGILADDDREALLSKGLSIAPSSKTRLLDEEFIAYKALTTPSQQLFISYPLANEEGKALLPSSYIKRLKEMFPYLKEKMDVNEPSELMAEKQLDYISHPNTAISYLTAQLQLKKRLYPVADFWWDVYNFYIESPQWKDKAVHVLSSIFFQNKALPISETTSKDLYGDEILASVSRMELFHGCPFSHFATHGLKLREREIYRLEAPDIGDLFHGALKWISEEIQREGLTWASLTKKQCAYLAKEAVNFLAPKLQHQILLSSNRHFYIKRKLEQVIGRASHILSEHAKVSGFVPIGMELAFGPDASLPPLSFSLKNGTKMQLQGRIDRVDKAEDSNGVYLRIIDYKSSSRDLELTEVYYGLALQMLTYLDVIVTHSDKLVGSEAIPAGVLYFHLHNPVVSSNKILTMEEIEEEIFKSFKMKGLLLGNTDVIKLMDQTLETGSSQIISAGLKKDGNLASHSQVAGQDEFKHLNKYVRNLYESSGNAIASGTVDISPYKLKKKTPCEFCSFRSVCQFDQSLEDNQYRILSPQKSDDVLARIREEAGLE